MNNQPLSLLLENVRQEMYKALNKVLSETGVPAYLCEGILQDLLAEVRKQKCYEIMNEIIRFNAQNAQKEGQNDENKD